MSFGNDGIRITPRNSRTPKGGPLRFLITGAEVVLTLFFFIAVGAHLFYPSASFSATGSPQLLAYQGYLTDASGNSLGGTGTPYCFRFSIYDSPTVGAGTKLWPAGTPATTMATTTDGVFSALIGAADALTYNFYDNDTTYLNVEVNTTPATCGGSWQTLSPRQQIVSGGYAISTENIYGSLLQSQTSNSRVQVGSGSGTPTPIYFGLDVKSTADYVGQACSTSGTVWYNSAISKALVCENGLIQAMSNAGATTTLAGISTNTAAAASTGTIVFSNSNGVTFGINGNTITASANAGGGSTLSTYVPVIGFQGSTASQTLGLMGATSGSVLLIPVSVNSSIAFNAIRLVGRFSYATSTVSGQQTISSSFGLFSRNANTLSLISSNSFSLAVTNSSVSATLSYPNATATTGYAYGTTSASTTAQIHSFFGTVGNRRIDLQFGNTMSLTPGMYWLGVIRRESSSSANIGISGALVGNAPGFNSLGWFGRSSAASTTNLDLRAPYYGLGYYTVTASSMPGSVATNAINQSLGTWPLMTFMSTT